MINIKIMVSDGVVDPQSWLKVVVPYFSDLTVCHLANAICCSDDGDLAIEEVVLESTNGDWSVTLTPEGNDYNAISCPWSAQVRMPLSHKMWGTSVDHKFVEFAATSQTIGDEDHNFPITGPLHTVMSLGYAILMTLDYLQDPA